jgi:hypothetical protein
MAITLGSTGYCEEAEIQGKTQQSYTTTTNPTTAEVEQFITDVMDEIDGRASAGGYTMPMDTASIKASRILKNINTLGASVKAEDARNSPGGSGRDSRSSRIQGWQDEYKSLLDKLSKGPTPGGLDLIDHPAGSEPLSPGESVVESEFRLDSNSEEEDPKIKMDTKF